MATDSPTKRHKPNEEGDVVMQNADPEGLCKENENDDYVRLPLLCEHKKAVSSIKISPVESASSLALACSSSADGSLKIWDVKKSVTEKYFNANSKLDIKNVRNAVTPAVSTLTGHSQGVNDLTWAADGRYIASASDDKTIRLWDVNTGDSMVEFQGHSNFVFCLAFNPQSNILCSGSFDEHVKLWDVRSGDCVSTLPAHSDPVTGVDFNRDGTCIVSGSHDGLIRIWDTATSECLKTIYAEGKFVKVVSFKIFPNL